MECQWKIIIYAIMYMCIIIICVEFLHVESIFGGHKSKISASRITGSCELTNEDAIYLTPLL